MKCLFQPLSFNTMKTNYKLLGETLFFILFTHLVFTGFFALTAWAQMETGGPFELFAFMIGATYVLWFVYSIKIAKLYLVDSIRD